MSSNVVSSAIFALRNVDKFENGDLGRLPVAAAQGVNVATNIFEDIAKYNERIAKGAEGALNAFNKVAERSKVVEGAGKAVSWARRNVNPMICVSGGLKVLMSDDKPKAAVTEAAALATMFAGERLMKSGALEGLFNSKVVTNCINYLKNAKYSKPTMEVLSRMKLNGKVGTIVKGSLFVAGSIASYALGQKIGEDFYVQTSSLFGSNDGKIDLKS